MLNEIDKSLNPNLAIQIYGNPIENFGEDRLMIIISHHKEVQNLFDKHLMVDKRLMVDNGKF